MTQLNRAFGVWIDQQIADQPSSIWSEGLKVLLILSDIHSIIHKPIIFTLTYLE